MSSYWLYDSDEQMCVSFEYFHRANFVEYHYPRSPDANGLFAFMVEQLQQAEDAGQRAWIIGHIPSGKADLQHDFVREMPLLNDNLADVKHTSQTTTIKSFRDTRTQSRRNLLDIVTK